MASLKNFSCARLFLSLSDLSFCPTLPWLLLIFRGRVIDPVFYYSNSVVELRWRAVYENRR